MTNVLLGTLTAGMLAFGFACVGETLLGRSSRNLSGWNESFLIGTGACAALLFPLSLLAPHGALDVELGLLLVSICAVAWRRYRSSREAGPEPGDGSADLEAAADDGVAILLLAAIATLALFFAALNLWSGHTWDSVQVWGTKAQLLFVEGGLPRQWFPEEAYDSRLLAYPPMISLVEAAFSRLRGSFDFDSLKLIFPYFYLSMLVGTYAAARTQCSRRWSLGCVLLVALLPELTTGAAAGGYVDMPLAAFVAAMVAACLRHGGTRSGWRSPLPWLIGAMTTVKQEGMILALLACGGIFLFWAFERPRRLGARVRSGWSGAAVVLAFIAARVGYVRWTGVHDGTWGPLDAEHRIRALQGLRLVASLGLRFLLAPGKWGLFWPTFFLAGGLMLAWRQTRPALLALAVAAAIVIEASVFLFTNWDIELHMEGAYSRLLAQLVPAAAVVIVAAASRIWSPSAHEAA
jgi:hypothetical protein